MSFLQTLRVVIVNLNVVFGNLPLLYSVYFCRELLY